MSNERGQRNLIELYLPLCDRWIVYDNSKDGLEIVAQREEDGQPMIISAESWNQITGG
jgi:predicted ABC-type ATPase